MSDLQTSGAISGNSSVAKYITSLGDLIKTSFTVYIGEPTRVLGDFEGSGNDWNRLLSFLRERDGEVQLLRTRLVDTEKKAITSQYSGVDAERTIASLRKENSELSRQVDSLKTQLSQVGGNTEAKYRELELKYKSANSRIQEL